MWGVNYYFLSKKLAMKEIKKQKTDKQITTNKIQIAVILLLLMMKDSILVIIKFSGTILIKSGILAKAIALKIAKKIINNIAYEYLDNEDWGTEGRKKICLQFKHCTRFFFRYDL